MVFLKWIGALDMEKSGTEFLNRRYKDMHMSDVVMHTASPSDKPSEKIEKYLDRLEHVHEKAMNHPTDTGIRSLKKFYYDHYVIKPENISDKYWQFLDSQYFEQYGIHLNEQLKQQHIQTILADQKTSIDKWVDYLSSEDARFYPTWAKYWAFQGMLNIGAYDNKNDVYKRRDKSTVAPFVDLNQEALAKVIDMVVQSVNQEQVEENFQPLVENGNFRKLYTLLLKKHNEKIMSDANTAGVWKKYDMGSDYHPLWESLQGKNTGWCTAGADTCKHQLAEGDFYVYYTYDEKGKATNPRLAIRMDGTEQIGEIRGIAQDQNIEPNFEEIVEEKIQDFPDRDKYKKRLHDTKMLTTVYNRYQNHEMLTKDDLLFIYGNVEGCGWHNDPRLNELRKVALKTASEELKNNPEVVLAAVKQNYNALEYASGEIKSNPEFMLEALKQYYRVLQYASGDLKSDFAFMLEAVKQNGFTLEYASEELRSNPEIVMEAVKHDYHILQYASKELRSNPTFMLKAVKKDYHALQYAGEELKSNPEIIMEAVKQNGLALQYASEELKSNLEIVMEAIKQNYKALEYTSDEVKSNPEIMLEAVKQDYHALQYARGDLKSNFSFMLEAVKQDGLALIFASKELKSNPEIVMEAVKQNGLVLGFASEELKSNLEIIMEAVKQNGLALQYASDELKSNPEIVMRAVKQNYYALIFASQELKNNPEVVMTAVQSFNNLLDEYRKDSQTDFNQLRNEIEDCGTPLRCASDELRKNPEFMLEAIKVCEYVMIDADPTLKQDKKFVLKAIQVNPDVYLGEEWKDDVDIRNAIVQEKEKREKAKTEQASLSTNPAVSNAFNKEVLVEKIVADMVNGTKNTNGGMSEETNHSSKAK